MNDGYDPGQPAGPPEGLVEPKKRGCLFWGCIIALILIVCIGGCITFAGYQLVQVLKEYTATEPQQVPEYQLRPGEYEEVLKRTEGFRQAPEQPEPLVLTANDLNALLSGWPELKKIKGKRFVRIEGDKIFMDVSVPLEGFPFLSDRYLNATMRLEVGIIGGRPWLGITEVTANGEKLPPEVMKSLGETNLLSKVRNEEFLDFIRSAKSIEVRDGKVTLKK